MNRDRLAVALEWTVGLLVLTLIIVSVLSAAANAAASRGPRCFDRRPTYIGDRTAEVIVGNMGNDVIIGRKGDDGVLALAGNDRVCGGRGSDDLDGGPGFDRVRGGRGYDRCVDFEITRGCEQFD